MLRGVLIASAVLLAGCEQKTWTRAEIADIAEDQADARVASAESRISDLEDEISELKSQSATQVRIAEDTAATARATAETVAFNARVNNENTLKDATARGACGREGYWESAGIYRTRNIPCTAENYFQRR